MWEKSCVIHFIFKGIWGAEIQNENNHCCGLFCFNGRWKFDAL